MLDVYHLDTDSIVAPEDQLNYYLISNPNNASPWDPNSGQPHEQYQVQDLYYFTNDEGLNVVTSNPEDDSCNALRVFNNDFWGCW